MVFKNMGVANRSGLGGGGSFGHLYDHPFQ